MSSGVIGGGDIGKIGDAVELVERLRRRGFPALAELPDQLLLEGWCATIEALADPSSPERRALDPPLLESSRLSPEGLSAGLRILTWGARREVAEQALERARPHKEARVTLVILASTPPGLALQPLLPALVRRSPLLFKSSSAEPCFAPALLEALAARLEAARDAYAALVWPGGERPELEDALYASVDLIVHYGGAESTRRLAAGHPGKVVSLGPKASVALVSADALMPSERTNELGRALAEDIALFDQRGCLSLQAVFTDGDGEALARALAAGLEEVARRLPAGPIDPSTALAVQQARAEALMTGRWLSELPLGLGTVILHRPSQPPSPTLLASPGARTVRVYALPYLAHALATLESMTDLLQGAVLEGAAARQLEVRLRALGVTQIARSGRLQWVDALWRNGGFDPLELY